MLAFKATNGKGNNLFIDNIAVDIRYKNDVAIAQLITPSVASCNKDISPVVQLINKGNANLASVKISYIIDGGNTVLSNWMSNLQKDDSISVTLNSSTISVGKHQIKLFTALPNGMADGCTLNDTIVANLHYTNRCITFKRRL